PRRPRSPARVPGLVRPACPALGHPLRAGPPLHRRALVGLSAYVVACRVRERGAALRKTLGADQGALAREGAHGGRGDRVRRRLCYGAAMLVAAATLVVCTAAPATPPPATPGVGLMATFVLANPAGLLALDAAGRVLG